MSYQDEMDSHADGVWIWFILLAVVLACIYPPMIFILPLFGVVAFIVYKFPPKHES